MIFKLNNKVLVMQNSGRRKMLQEEERGNTEALGND